MDDLNAIEFLPFHSIADFDFQDFIRFNSTNNLIINDCSNQLLDFNFINNLVYDQFDCSADDNDLLNAFFNEYDKINDCNYYMNPSEIINNEEKSLSLCCLNINSIPKNLLEFSTQCLSNLNFTFDVLGFVETKLTDDIDHLYNIPSYSKYTLNSKRSSGGLAVFFKNNLNVKLREDLNRQMQFIETLFVEIETDNKNIICGIIYRRPNASKPQFINELESILSLLERENKYINLMGDFNINLLTKNDNSTDQLVNLMHSFNLVNSINKPTRVTHTSATIIDHVWTNAYAKISNNGIIYDFTSDHFPIFCILQFNIPHDNDSKHKVIKFRNYSEENINSFKNNLNEVDWTLVESIDNPNVAYDNFSSIFYNVFNKNFPIITKRKHVKPFEKPYIDFELKQLINQKNKLQKKYAKHPITYANEYKALRNRVTGLIRNAKAKYFKDRLNGSSGDSKKTWNVINDIIKPKSENPQCKFVNISFDENNIIENDFITDPGDVVDKFNTYFTKVGPVLSSKIPQGDLSCLHFMGLRNPNNFSFVTVSEAEVCSLMLDLEDGAAGYDEIPAKVIKYALTFISQPLTHIINRSLLTGVVPSRLKIARVTPIFKKGSKQLFSNYCPISVLPVISKVLEKIVHIQLSSFLNEYDIIKQNQLGFQEKKSTTAAILKFTDYILNSFDAKKHVIGIFLDLAKAFDTVDHKILLKKLDHYGVRDESYKWFESYLNDRQQFVTYNNNSSTYKPVSHSVPQGSLLGPLLFNIYINDIINTPQHLTSILFADDSCFYLSGPTIEPLINYINFDSINIHKWLVANRLTLNIDKSHFIIFSRKKTPTHSILHNPLKINNNILKRVHETNFLGLILTHNLSWKNQINDIVNRLNKYCSILYLTKDCLTINPLKLIYHSVI